MIRISNHARIPSPRPPRHSQTYGGRNDDHIHIVAPDTCSQRCRLAGACADDTRRHSRKDRFCLQRRSRHQPYQVRNLRRTSPNLSRHALRSRALDGEGGMNHEHQIYRSPATQLVYAGRNASGLAQVGLSCVVGQRRSRRTKTPHLRFPCAFLRSPKGLPPRQSHCAAALATH